MPFSTHLTLALSPPPPPALPPSRSLSLSLTLLHSFTLAHSVSLSHSLSHSPTHSHFLALSLQLSDRLLACSRQSPEHTTLNPKPYGFQGMGSGSTKSSFSKPCICAGPRRDPAQLWYKCTGSKDAIWSYSEGWWEHRLLAIFDAVEYVSLLEQHRLDQLPVGPGSSGGSNRLFHVLNLPWRAPESGDVWYTLRQSKMIMCDSYG